MTRDVPIGDPTQLGTVLSVWAHPDDETYLAGGLFTTLRDAGLRVVCVTATRGEAADPDATDQERRALAELRTAELDAALALLGVEEHHWLGHPDGGCADVPAEGPAARIAELVEAVRPDTVVTFGPDGFTGHPDHRAVSEWVDLALRRTDLRPTVLHAVDQEPSVDPALDADFNVFELGEPRRCTDDELSLRLPLTGTALERKVEALLSQSSQTSGLVTAVGRERFTRWVATETFAPPARQPASQQSG